MGVTVCLPLFAAPCKELTEGSAVSGEQLRKLGDELRDRLRKAGETLEKLRSAGWSTELASTDVLLSHPRVRTQEDALKQLQELGIDAEEVLVVEDIDEDSI